MPVQSVVFRTFSYATEDEEKVRTALRNAAGMPEAKPTETMSEGHHGAPIIIMELVLKRRGDLLAWFRRLNDEGGLRLALDTADQRLDEAGFLHLRFEKQDAYRGRLAMAASEDVIDVRCKLVSHPASRAGRLAELRSFAALAMQPRAERGTPVASGADGQAANGS